MARTKATKSELPSYINKGGDAVSAEGGGLFASIKEGESILFAPLVSMSDVLSVNMHEIWEIRPAIFIPCIGAGCEPCAQDHKSRFRAYLPILTKDGEVKILPIGVTVFRQLKTIAEDVDIKGKVMRLRRTGSGRYNTTYTLVAIGKEQDVSKIELPNIVEAIGPTDMEGIEKLWVQAGFVEGDDDEPTAEEEVSEAFGDDVTDDDDDWDPDL
jgi:hypothetical protein